jgi:hypothetical protein
MEAATRRKPMNLSRAAATLGCMLIPLATPATATKRNSITAAAIAAEQVTIGAPGERMAL